MHYSACSLGLKMQQQHGDELECNRLWKLIIPGIKQEVSGFWSISFEIPFFSREASVSSTINLVTESYNFVDKIKRHLWISENKIGENFGKVKKVVVLMEVYQGSLHFLLRHFQQQPNLHAFTKG